MSSDGQGPASLALPPVRDDLRLLEGPPDLNGAPTWTIHDPLRNKYFRIGWSAFELLSRWSLGTAEDVVEGVNQDTTCAATLEDVTDLVKFLFANNLTRDPATGDVSGYLAQAQAMDMGWGRWLLHNYLFFRVPLVKPDRFLRATLPWVSPLFSPRAQLGIVAFGLLGLYLASRQWDAFRTTFLHFFTWEGLLLYGVAQIFVKILHELGHAYTATRYGCRVPTMGVAFLVMFPVLYTDTTDAWKLPSRRQRLHIAGAGMLTELWLAALATLVWSFLADGPLRSAAFVVATTSWTLTLLVNLSPFMRFDGYYLLADWLGVGNLQQRAFALGRWQLREWFLDLEDEPPGEFPPAMRLKLTIYAFCTWVYRFFLFLGIALLVYHFFFKLLGLLLFAVEIAWFLVLPITNELRAWWERREEVSGTRRGRLLAGVCAAALLLLFVPWNTRVSLPGVLEARDHAWLYAPQPGRILEVHVRERQSVREGDVLVSLESPAIDFEMRAARKRSAYLKIRAGRRAASAADLAEIRVVLQQLEEETSRLQALEERLETLTIRAPLDGVVTDLAPSLHAGRWINPELPLAFVADPGTLEIQALAESEALGRLEVDQTARFFPDDPARDPVPARVVEVGQASLHGFDIPYLASLYGGPVAVRRDPARQGLVPESSVYRIRLESDGDVRAPRQVLRGVVHVSGRARSFASRLFELVAAVLIRESGF